MVRSIAVDALYRMKKTQCLAQDAINHLLRGKRIEVQDRAFLWELVLGVTRHRDTLDRILQAFSRVKLRNIHPCALEAIRLGIYQMVYLDRVPDHAAVHDAVEAVKSSAPGWTVGFANGCLRSVGRSIEIKVGGLLTAKDTRRAVPIRGRRYCLFTDLIFSDPEEDLAASLSERHSHPRFLVDRWIEEYGAEETVELLWAGNEPPALWLRPAPGKLAALSRELTKRAIRHDVETQVAEAILLRQPIGQVHELPGYHRGWFTVQDRAAMQAAPFLDPQPGDRILDLCAAPGGKTAHLAALAGPTARITALDRDGARLAKVRETIARLGIENVELVHGDARSDDLSLGEPFDRVLADVPCSNTAVLARRVEARHRVNAEQVEAVRTVQSEILAAAAHRVRPGGTLVYSTCALLAEENRENIERFLDLRADFDLDDDLLTFPSGGFCDGGYLARLVRTGGGGRR
jgi:16S rRNA (cytosine967-C5)-methyltransferase